MRYNSIVCTTDLSEASSLAFATAAGIAEDYAAKLEIWSVFPTFHIPPLLARQLTNEAALPKLRAEYEANCKEELAHFIKELSPSLATCEIRTIFSDESPATAIAGALGVMESPLLVVASHGRGSLEHVFIGSTVAKLVQLGPCPLLVVPRGGSV